MNADTKYSVCIIGGAGHVGLPLAVAFANHGIKTVILDIDAPKLEQIRCGIFPFKEAGGDEQLKNALAKGLLDTSSSPEVISQSEFVITVIGTPVDEHLNPNFDGILKTIENYLPFFRAGQILILRSTVFPGTSENLQAYLNSKSKDIQVAFCPERIVQGRALEELSELPQIISAFDEEALERVAELFSKVTSKKIIRVKPIEAELAKLFSNSWRYIRFAVGNQFYMIAQEKGLDYQKIYDAMLDDYPRNQNLPAPGFAAGPCLFKDTMQLAAFARNQFFLGHAAMLVNEGLPNFLINQLKQSHDLKTKTLAILGMAFKADNDDKRESLSYKLRRMAELECKQVMCHDYFIQDPRFHPLEECLEKADIVIVATPHSEYKRIDRFAFPAKIFVDIWNHLPAQPRA